MQEAKTIMYMRTDICDQELVAGGSVAHTLGVVQGLQQLGYNVICASSCMQALLKKQMIAHVITLKNPSCLHFLRWKINCFLSSFFFYRQVAYILKTRSIMCIYQRYSLLNITGVLLAKRFNKKLILEYNGSEAWIATHWIEKKRWITLSWLMYKIEKINISQADCVVVVSQALRDELVGRGVVASKIVVNPNGVDAQTYKNE